MRTSPRPFRPALEALEDRTVPSGIPSQWLARGAGGGGALFSPQISPYNANDVYVASDMSQLFHTTDAGATWQTVDFRQLQGGHETQVQFTEDPLIRYAVDYTSINGNDLQRPVKSTDGGVTWHALTNDPTGSGAFKLFADPANHNRLLLSDYTHLYFSADGGATWATRYTTSNTNAGLHLAGAFFDGSNVYVGTNAGLLVSTNGGASFAVSGVGGIPAAEAILSFAGAKQNGQVRFYAVTKAATDVYAGIQAWDYYGTQNVYTLDWGAGSWTLRMTGINNTQVNPWFVDLAQNNVNVAYVGGGSSATGAPTVFKTTDGGLHWTSVFQTANNQNVATGWQGQGGDRGWGYGEVALGFDVASNDANHVVITDFGFAHTTTDGGTSWHQLYVAAADQNPAGSPTPTGHYYHTSGLDNTSSWVVDWANTSHLIVGNSDVKAEISADGGQTFGFGYTGNNYNSTYWAVTAANGTVYAATSSVHDMYQSTHLTDGQVDGGTGAVLFSTNQGGTWQVLHDFGHTVMWVATDPTNSNRLYAAVAHSTAGGIYVTNNLSAGAASTWTRLASPPRTEGHAYNVRVLNDGSLVVSYSGRRNSSGAFTASSGVFYSTDGGQTWQDRSASGLQYWTHDVVIDPNDATQSTWYAGVYSGWGGAPNTLGGLYRTTNRGATWTRVSSLYRVSSVTFNPSDPNEAWVSTETDGLWYSNNVQAATPTFTQVANYPFRHPERVFYNPTNNNEIWVTSFGGGLFEGTVSTGSAGTLQFGNPTYSVGEGGGTLTVTVTRTGGSTGAIGVHYATADGTATAGSDYTAASGNLSWADGDTTSRTITIAITDDSLVEGNETFTIALSAATGGAALGSPATATATITDNDTAPAGTLQFSVSGYNVNENGGTATITVTRTGGGNGAVSVHYATSNGTATSGSDYTPASGTLSWADGDTAAKTFTVTILDDSLVEGNETVNLTLSNATGGASLGTPATATLTIADVEPGQLQFSPAAYTVNENAGTVTVTVTRTNGTTGAVSVHYATANGTATAGSDYTNTSGTLNFADGQASATFTVAILDDALVEGNETFTVSLDTATGGAVLGSPTTATVTITDNDAATHTYYVTMAGSDTADGSAATPWRTLQHAADLVRAGDTVIVRQGTYKGFDLWTSGTAAAPIQFLADAGVVINQANQRTADGINLEGASWIVIQGFTVRGMGRAGIRAVTDNHVTIRNNTCDQNTYWGIFTGFSDDLLIENNVASRSVQQHGIYVSNSGDRPVIRGNQTWGNRACGIQLNGDLSQGGDGIISNALIENNVIHDNGLGGGAAINCDGVQNSTIRNNLLYANHASGIALFRIDGGGPSKNNLVVNNTVRMPSDGRWALTIQNAGTGNKAYNNILYNDNTHRGSISLSADSLSGFVSDNNVVVARFSVDGGNTNVNLSQWRSRTGQDAHSLTATPTALWVNPSAGDYHLKAGSPAIDRGTATSAPPTDLEGTLRPQGAAVDIGAYEFRTTPAATGASPSSLDNFFASFLGGQGR